MRYSSRVVAWTCILVAIIGFSRFANATTKGHVELKTVVQKEVVSVDAQGKEKRKLVAVDTVTPGEEVVYTIFFTNVQAKPVEGVVIVDRIPEHTLYKAGTAFGSGTDIAFSVDGGKTFAAPEKLRVELDDGSTRAATAKDYSHVRWAYASTLLTEQQSYVRFRAVVK